MLRFILTLEAPDEESHVKNRVEAIGISIIKYLDNTSVSLRAAASAYAAYAVCIQSLKIGVSFIKPCRFISVEM